MVRSNFNIFLQLKTKNGTAAEKITVKISGDGTRMSHTSNLFVCSLLCQKITSTVYQAQVHVNLSLLIMLFKQNFTEICHLNEVQI